MARPDSALKKTLPWLGQRVRAGWGRARRSRAVGRGLLVIVAILLLAYVYQFARCSQLTPSGDALFDRYARAVRDRNAWKLFHGSAPAVLPDLLLASWEGDFGADPRYWELRYWSATAGPDAPRISDNADARGIIAAARRRDALDSDLAWFRWQAEFLRMRHEQDDAEYQRDKGSFEMAAMLEQYDQEELALLDSVVAGGPDKAWPYYFRARKHMELGEDQQALADLRAGNRAKEVGSPRLFPASKVYELAWQGAPAGSSALSGAVINLEQRRAVPNYIKIKECAKESLMYAGLGGDSALATQWFRAGCRMADDPQGDSIAGLTGRAIAGTINDYYLTELSAGLSHEQLMGLLAVDEALDEARESNRSFSALLEYEYPGLRLYQWRRQSRDSVMTREDGKSWGQLFKTSGQRAAAWLELKQGDLLPAGRYEQLFQQHSAESVFRREHLATLQLQLFDFDYATMQRPPGWPKDGLGIESQF